VTSHQKGCSVGGIEPSGCKVLAVSNIVSLNERREIRSYSLGGSQTDIFDGYAKINGTMAWSCRRCHNEDWYNTRIVVNGEDLDFGEDPRLFVHQGVLHVSCCVYNPGYGFRNHLIQLASARNWRRWILLPPNDVDSGKNWSPFAFPDGRLGFIHQFSPLVLLREIRRESGAMLMEALTGEGVAFEAGEGGFCAHRGGTNGIALSDEIFGIGHTTRVREANGERSIIHRPFAWWLDPTRRRVRVDEVQCDWDARYNIVDPTSLVRHEDGRIEVFTTEAYRSFIDPGGAARGCRYVVTLA
jgi:hypothetical protein